MFLRKRNVWCLAEIVLSVNRYHVINQLSRGVRYLTTTEARSKSDFTNETTIPKTFFTNMKEGDWVCPSCGVLSFSWRNTCFKCGTMKPSLSPQQQKSTLNDMNKRSRNKQTSKDTKIVSLKDLLIQSTKTRNYDLVLQEVDKRLKQKSFIKSSVVATMIQAFGKSGNIDRAIELFNDIGKHPYIVRRPTNYHYSATINACSQNGKWETALDVLDHMRANNRSHNVIVCTTAMSACNKAKQYSHVIRIFNTIQAEGLRLDTTCYNVAIDSFVKIGNYTRAYEVFEEMKQNKAKRDIHSFGIMLECCSKTGDWVLAKEILKEAKLKRNFEINSTICTSAMLSFTNGGQPDKALEFYSEFTKQKTILMDYPLYSAVLFTLYKLPQGSNSGIQSLEILQEMTKRHIKLSTYIITLVISCLDKEEMYDSADILYETAKNNGMFNDFNIKLTFPSEQKNDTTTTTVDGDDENSSSNNNNNDNDRRIDLRKSSAPMIRVVLRSIIKQVKLANQPPNDDLLIILGL